MTYYKYMSEPATVFDFGLTPEQEDRAKEVHEKIIIFDSLMECSWYEGILENMKRGGTPTGSISIGNAGYHNWKGRKEGITARPEDWWSAETLVKDIAFMNRKAREHADKIMLCFSASDIRKAKKEGKVGFIFDVQNTSFLENKPDRIDLFYDLGIRRVQLTYNRQNLAGSGCMELQDNGLSIWGRELVERMNEVKMIVDTGHCKSQTLIDAIDASSKPITCSHAGMTSLCNTPRSQTDEALKKLAESGGVFGVVSAPGALNGTDRCTVNDYLDTIEAAINLMGVEHVGFGTDLILAASLPEIFTAPEWGVKAAATVGVTEDTIWPWSDGHEGMENNSGYPNLTRGLVARGYSDEDIAKIMGGNFIRLYEEIIGD